MHKSCLLANEAREIRLRFWRDAGLPGFGIAGFSTLPLEGRQGGEIEVQH